MYKINLGNPTTELFKLLDELFEDSVDVTSRKSPEYDVIENDDEFIIEMELAGIKKEDITIETENGVLTVETERKIDKKKNYVRNELYRGKYMRKFIIDENTDGEKIKANMIDGILTITIPKVIEESKKKKVKVN